MMTTTYTKRDAVKHFREWYADLKAEHGGDVDRFRAWEEFLDVNVKEGSLKPEARDWVMP